MTKFVGKVRVHSCMGSCCCKCKRWLDYDAKMREHWFVYLARTLYHNLCPDCGEERRQTVS